MPIKKLGIEELTQFVTQTHIVEKIPCHYQDVVATLQTKNKNWHADGHLAAISYAINKVVESTDFPTRLPQITNKFHSEQALHWVKSLYTIMMTPLAKNPQPIFPGESVQQEQIKLSYLNTWRPEPTQNLYGPAPSPQLIPAIMHNWIVKLKSIHESIKDRLDNPYGITKEEFTPMKAFVEEQPYFFSVVQPFQYANNRFGRLIENVIRIAWRMPFRSDISRNYDKFIENLENYQTKELHKIVSAAKELKF